jgi:hypothetical protein
MAERGEEEQRHRRIDTQAREILRTQRRILTVADFMALLMVAATAFTALATWRTYKVSELIFAISDRPFIGVQQVTFERTDTAEPAIVVDFRNFGPIPADAAIVSVTALLDGRPVPARDGEMTSLDQGVVSPEIPHFFYVFLLQTEYKRAVSGAARLMVRVSIEYKGPALDRRFCYKKNLFLRSAHRHLPTLRRELDLRQHRHLLGDATEIYAAAVELRGLRER